MKKLFKTISLTLAICLSTIVTNASADFTIIVPFSAGGVYDKQARLFANYVTTTTGEKVVVKNLTGAGSIVGTKALLNSDDNTIMATSGSFYKNIVDGEFNKEDFRIVNVMGTSPFTLITGKNISCDDIKDKTKNFFIGTAGPGSASDTVSLILQSKYKNITIVSYKGISHTLTDLHAQRLDFVFVSGKPRSEFKAIASSTVNNVYKDVDNWKSCLDMNMNYMADYLMVAKSDSSEEFVKKVNDLTVKYLNSKEVRLDEDGILPVKILKIDKHYTDSLDVWKKIKNITD